MDLNGRIYCTYKILAVKAEGKRPVGGLRHKYKNNIKINLKAIEYMDMDRIQVACKWICSKWNHEPLGL